MPGNTLDEREGHMIQAIEAVVQTGSAGVGMVAASPAAARCLGRGAGTVITSHGDAAQARAAARQLVAGGARAILSFGPAVGLAPLLRPGDLVIAECVVMPAGETIATDVAWRTELEQRLSVIHPGLTVARLAGRDRLAASAAEKRAVFRETFAAAQDSESHAIAAVAQAAGLPFVAVRAIADPAEENRPTASAARNAYAASLAAYLGRPWELPALWRFARNGRAALATLRQVASVRPWPHAQGG
jgi:adenosylhomocysteine nucleosidase